MVHTMRAAVSAPVLYFGVFRPHGIDHGTTGRSLCVHQPSEGNDRFPKQPKPCIASPELRELRITLQRSCRSRFSSPMPPSGEIPAEPARELLRIQYDTDGLECMAEEGYLYSGRQKDLIIRRNPMNKQLTVADYIVQRLAREGITDCFGVAGDFAFELYDAVARSEAIRWIGCSNELDAAYAADGYARVRGCSMLLTTYAVGELSALNGVMGAKAERSCVFHLVGMPSMRHQRVHKIVHHTLGDGEFQNFANISAQAACVSAVITPDNCADEMERLIATARAESRPAYILVASDYAITPVADSDPIPYPKPASGPDLAKSVAAITERIEAARSLAVLPAYTVSRFKLQDSLRALIEALGCPFAAMAMDKGVLSEAHPQFVGIYSGAASSPAVLEAVEGADLVIDAGGVCFHDINTSAYSSRIAPERLLTIDVDHVRIGDRIYNPVRMGDVFEMLARSVRKNFGYSAPPRETTAKPGGKPNDPITAAAMYSRYRDFLKPTRSDCHRERQFHLGDRPAPAARRRGGALPDPLGLDRMGHRGHAGDRSGRPIATDRALHRRGLTPAHCRRRRHDGTQRFEADHLRPQQRGLHGRAGTRDESGLGLQRPRPLELS